MFQIGLAREPARLKKRNVPRVALAYIVTDRLIVQVADTLIPVYGLSGAAVRIVLNMPAICLALMLVFARVFEWVPEGINQPPLSPH